jgi:membrane-associated phospholipid phosphatase
MTVDAPDRPASDRPADRTAATRVARLITEVFAPAVLLGAQLVLVGRHTTGSYGWGVVGAVFAVGIPYAFVVWGVRRGRYADHHIPERAHRRTPLIFALGSAAVGLGLLAVAGAPRPIIALLVSGGAGLVVFGPITHWWKISLHAGIAGGTVAVLTLVYGPWALLGLPVVVLVCWSRVRLRVHTVAQVAVGGTLGALVAGTAFTLAR